MAAPDQPVGLSDSVLAWFARHPGFQAARAVFAELLGAAMAPLGPGVQVPEKLLQIRKMLATRMEQWKQRVLPECEKRGEATPLLRQMGRRFGVVPG